MHTNILIIISCVLGGIVFDIITGVSAAAKRNRLDSQIMKKGLYNKLGLIFCVAIALFVDILSKVPEFAPFLGQFGTPIFVGTCAYIIIMEVLSSIENICFISPGLKNSPVGKLLLKSKDEHK